MLLSLVKSYIAVLTKPGSKAPFDAAKSQANWVAVIGGVLLAGLVHGILGYITVIQATPSVGVAGWINNIITITTFELIGFSIIATVIFLAARSQGGRADFLANAYMLSLAYVPTMLASEVLGLIPAVSELTDPVFVLYGLFLVYYGVQSFHSLKPIKALIVIGILVTTALVLGFLLFGLLGQAPLEASFIFMHV